MFSRICRQFASVWRRIPAERASVCFLQTAGMRGCVWVFGSGVSVYPIIFLLVRLSVCVSVRPSVRPSTFFCLSVCQALLLPICQSAYLYVSPFFRQLVFRLPIFSFLRPCVRLPISVSVELCYTLFSRTTV